jgi:hypothetical protein
MTKIKYKQEFKEINTQEKAYILGLFYSDGYMYKRDPSYFCGITLHKTDEYIFDKITELFPFFTKSYDKSKPNVALLRCNQKSFYEDLLENGCLPRKSFENKDLIKLPNLNDDLLSHFVRGFFDGDGSVYFSKTSSINTKYCTFTGVCNSLFREIQSLLENYSINFRLTVSKVPTVHSEHRIKQLQEVYILTISNRENINNFFNYLYRDSNIHFSRKKDIMETWYEVFKMIKKPCKHCGSNNTVGNGKIKNQQRFLCKDCHKNSCYDI